MHAGEVEREGSFVIRDDGEDAGGADVKQG